MKLNQLPAYDTSDNPTGCCPRFKPDAWDGQDLHLKDKAFVRAETKSAMHIPLNMGSVFTRVQNRIEAAGAFDPDNHVVLSKEISAWKAEHFFAVAKPVPDEEMTTLSGDYITKVFEGPYRDAGSWHEQMIDLVRATGGQPGSIYFYYPTCPKCAKTYGENYCVGVAQVKSASR